MAVSIPIVRGAALLYTHSAWKHHLLFPHGVFSYALCSTAVTHFLRLESQQLIRLQIMASRVPPCSQPNIQSYKKVKVKASHTRYRALGPELIPVYRQSACR